MLSVEDLSLSFASKKLFSHLSFRLEKKDLLWVKGKNGCGKSSLLRICAGLSPATSGKVIRDQKDRLEMLSAEHLGLFSDLSAFENLSFWAKLRHSKQINDELIRQELQFWHLPYQPIIKDLSVKYFSTGMKKRLSLARMRLSRAPLWLMDEPTFGLDTQGLELLEQVICDHVEKGNGLILVCHDTSFLKGMNVRELLL